jgi:succinoglycan biosynthesis protein ExoW
MSKVAVVIPFFQREAGILRRTVQSALMQAGVDLHILVVSDGSPISAEEELREYLQAGEKRITVIEQENAGPGAARNRALDAVPEGTEYVAFLDSDDSWLPGHIERAVLALDRGYDFYFSDFYFSDFKEKSAFARGGKIPLERHKKLLDAGALYEYQGDMLDQILIRGNVIGTSNVVYRYKKHPELRFREAFFNGQDYLFWLDFFSRGGRAAFSPVIECDCGTGINIYAGAGWDTDRSLDRLRNELKLWTAVASIYRIGGARKRANRKKVGAIRVSIIRDVIHRIMHRKKLHRAVLMDILRIDPSIFLFAPRVFASILTERLTGRLHPQ